MGVRICSAGRAAAPAGEREGGGGEGGQGGRFGDGDQGEGERGGVVDDGLEGGVGPVVDDVDRVEVVDEAVAGEVAGGPVEGGGVPVGGEGVEVRAVYRTRVARCLRGTYWLGVLTAVHASGGWAVFWLFWVVPLLGGLLGGWVYKFFFGDGK